MPDESLAQPPNQPSPGENQKRRRLPIWFLFLVVGSALFILGWAFFPTFQNHGTSPPRIRSQSQLRQIGQGIFLYAQGSNGQYPDTLGQLLLNEDMSPAVFVYPDSKDTPAQGDTPQAQAADLANPGHCSYIYLGKGLTTQTAAPEMVIACEPLADHGDGINVLFGDGHAEFEGKPIATAILNLIAGGAAHVTVSLTGVVAVIQPSPATGP